MTYSKCRDRGLSSRPPRLGNAVRWSLLGASNRKPGPRNAGKCGAGAPCPGPAAGALSARMPLGLGCYIGSHACKALAAKDYVPITYDYLSRGNRWAV